MGRSSVWKACDIASGLLAGDVTWQKDPYKVQASIASHAVFQSQGSRMRATSSIANHEHMDARIKLLERLKGLDSLQPHIVDPAPSASDLLSLDESPLPATLKGRLSHSLRPCWARGVAISGSIGSLGGGTCRTEGLSWQSFLNIMAAFLQVRYTEGSSGLQPECLDTCGIAERLPSAVDALHTCKLSKANDLRKTYDIAIPRRNQGGDRGAQSSLVAVVALATDAKPEIEILHFPLLTIFHRHSLPRPHHILPISSHTRYVLWPSLLTIRCVSFIGSHAFLHNAVPRCSKLERASPPALSRDQPSSPSLAPYRAR